MSGPRRFHRTSDGIQPEHLVSELRRNHDGDALQGHPWYSHQCRNFALSSTLNGTGIEGGADPVCLLFAPPLPTAAGAPTLGRADKRA